MILEEHNRTHSPTTTQTKSTLEQLSVPNQPVPNSIKSSELLNGTNPTSHNSEKSTPPSKAKVHRCRQCSFVSSVKVKILYIIITCIPKLCFVL